MRKVAEAELEPRAGLGEWEGQSQACAGVGQALPGRGPVPLQETRVTGWLLC